MSIVIGLSLALGVIGALLVSGFVYHVRQSIRQGRIRFPFSKKASVAPKAEEGIIDSPVGKVFEILRSQKVANVLSTEEIQYIMTVLLANKESYELEFASGPANNHIDDETKAWIVETFLQSNYNKNNDELGPNGGTASNSLHNISSQKNTSADNPPPAPSANPLPANFNPGRRASVGKTKVSMYSSSDPFSLKQHSGDSAPHVNVLSTIIQKSNDELDASETGENSKDGLFEKTDTVVIPSANVTSQYPGSTTISIAPHSTRPTSLRQSSAQSSAVHLDHVLKTIDQDRPASIAVSMLSTKVISQFDHESAFKQLEDMFTTWDVDWFDFNDSTGGHALYFAGLYALKKFNIIDTYQIPLSAVQSWLLMMEKEYTTQPYHNSVHGTDVLHAMSYLALENNFLRTKLTMNEVFAAIIGAVGHDVDHPGVNNAFLIKTRHKYALMYSDTSVNENHHCAVVFMKTMDNPEVNIFSTLSPEDYEDIRKCIIRLILATDMSKHFSILTQFKNRVEAASLDNLEVTDTRWSVLEVMIKCADLSNSTKKMNVSKKWVDKVMEEFYTQGDKERSLGLPISQFMDRNNSNIPKCQTGFIDVLVNPLYEALNVYCQRFSSQMIVPMTSELAKNRAQWVQLTLSTPDLLTASAAPPSHGTMGKSKPSTSNGEDKADVQSVNSAASGGAKNVTKPTTHATSQQSSGTIASAQVMVSASSPIQPSKANPLLRYFPVNRAESSTSGSNINKGSEDHLGTSGYNSRSFVFPLKQLRSTNSKDKMSNASVGESLGRVNNVSSPLAGGAKNGAGTHIGPSKLGQPTTDEVSNSRNRIGNRSSMHGAEPLAEENEPVSGQTTTENHHVLQPVLSTITDVQTESSNKSTPLAQSGSKRDLTAIQNNQSNSSLSKLNQKLTIKIDLSKSSLNSSNPQLSQQSNPITKSSLGQLNNAPTYNSNTLVNRNETTVIDMKHSFAESNVKSSTAVHTNGAL